MTSNLMDERILVAEDDPVSRLLLVSLLKKWGYDTVVTTNGAEAWHVLTAAKPPLLAIMDWMMPEVDGVELCRKVREVPEIAGTYIILLTVRTGIQNAVLGLKSGADDFVTKPFNFEELQARVQVGLRVARFQVKLAERVQKLEEAMTKVKQLQGIVPICSYCKRIRNDRNYWQQLESYISEHSEAQFSHGVCLDCFEKQIQPESADFPSKVENKGD
jgi:phosphoserine phosphatase RsbU/P